MSERAGHRRGGVRRWAVGILVLVLVAAAAFWAGRVTTRPAEQTEQTPADEAVIEVVEQELGRVITLTTTVTRPSTPLASNLLTGTVTEVSEGGEFTSGDLLYTVGNTPVVLVQGQVPFWRDLGQDVEGSDVAQVQQMLVDAGHNLDIDGVWDAFTTEAVRDWQAEQGFAVTGSFPHGSLVASPQTPVSVDLDSEVAWPGAMLSGGESVVSVADGDPSFAMEVTQPQAELLPAGTTVTVQGDESGWEGVITESTVGQDGLFLLTLTAPDGGLLCGDECEQLPAEGSTTLLTQAALVPPVTGPVVPLAALSTQPDNSTTVDVVTDTGVQTTQVQVRTVADGLAVVDGVAAGDRVRVFGDSSAGSLPEQDSTAPGEGSTSTEEPPEPDGQGTSSP